MSTQIGQIADPAHKVPNATPSWRALAVLVIFVLVAHALLLSGSPSRFGPEPKPPANKAFVTRSITPPLPPLPPQAAPVPANPLPVQKAAPRKAVSQPIKKADSTPKQAVAPVLSTPLAINSEVSPLSALAPQPDTLAADSTSGETDRSARQAAAAAAATASSPSPAASSAVASAPPPSPVLPTPTPVTAMNLPASVRLDYKMTGSSKGLTYHAKGELGWTTTGNNYEARIVVSALFLGARSMISTGNVGPEGLAPIRFSDKSRSEVAAHFEPEKGQISFSANTPSLPWIKGTQDRVSVFIQLGGMLAGNPAAFPVGSMITMYTVGPRTADAWTFKVDVEETLDLPFGQMPALKLTRQPRGEYDQKVEVWFAPSLVYLPVRTKITQANGDFVDQQLTTVSRP